MACSLKKFGECNPKKSAITVVRDEFERYEYPIVCNQCDEPVCQIFCPQNAYHTEDGIVKKDDEKCMGCRLCSTLCPFSAITVLDKTIIKCDLCNQNPECVKFCSTGAIEYIEETAEQMRRRKEFVRKIKSFQ